MARELDQFPGRARGPRRYPWDEWTNGRAHELERGIDFDQDVDDFRNRLYEKASKGHQRPGDADKTTWEGCRTHRYFHARGEREAEQLRDEHRSTPVYVLPDLIAEADDADVRRVLEDRLARLVEHNEDFAELLAIQFYGPSV